MPGKEYNPKLKCPRRIFHPVVEILSGIFVGPFERLQGTNKRPLENLCVLGCCIKYSYNHNLTSRISFSYNEGMFCADHVDQTGGIRILVCERLNLEKRN